MLSKSSGHLAAFWSKALVLGRSLPACDMLPRTGVAPGDARQGTVPAVVFHDVSVFQRDTKLI